MAVERVDNLGDPRLADYRHVPDPELLRRGELFVAEGRLVVRALLGVSSFGVRSLLVTEAALDALRDALEPHLPGLAVYVVGRKAIQELTGFNIHRGCLAIGERRPPAVLGAFLEAARDSGGPLVVLEQVGNADNMGGIFRNAAAFGAAGVVLGPSCCDPLYRKAIRTSMGAALLVPFAYAGEWPAALGRLRAAGFTLVGLTPGAGAASIEDVVTRSAGVPAVALVAGSEGQGLSTAALAAVDVAVRIPMASGVDSLNVATAVGIALHRFAAR